MVVHLTYQPVDVIARLLADLIESVGLPVKMLSSTQILLLDRSLIHTEKYQKLLSMLEKFGIYSVEDPKEALISEIRTSMSEVIEDENYSNVNLSTHLSEKLKYSYPYLSTFFKEHTFISIENYYTYLRIQRAKSLILQGFTLTEIAYKLKYCNVAHLSRQFKKITGLNFKEYRRIIQKKIELKKSKSN